MISSGPQLRDLEVKLAKVPAGVRGHRSEAGAQIHRIQVARMVASHPRMDNQKQKLRLDRENRYCCQEAGRGNWHTLGPRG